MTIILLIASILATVVPFAGEPTAAAGRSMPDPSIAPPAGHASLPQRGPPVVDFTPSSPIQGSVVVVRVRADKAALADTAELVNSPALAGEDRIIAVNATLAGEPLHFSLDSAGTWLALGGIPIETTGTVHVPVILEWAAGRVDTVAASFTVAAGEYAMEKLTVAPRFGAPPDSALSARMARESARARAVSARSHDTPRLWDSTWVRPRDTRITSGFGHGRQFNGRVQSRHMGVDFAGAVGTPIRAANRGVVALVDEFYLGGNVIYLDHGAGVVTAYLHLSKHEVAEGDTVERGQIIGRVGATGRVTGPHLHWIARYGGITINPLSLVELPRESIAR